MDRKLLGQRIKARRTELRLTQKDIADSIGVATSTIQRYETAAIESVKLPVVEAIARTLQVSPAWLIGKSEQMEADFSSDFPSPQITDDVVTFPVIGEVAAGYEHIALEDWSGETVEIPRQYLHGRPKSEYMVLSVRGDSMYPLYIEGDKVLVLKQSTLNRSGEIGLVRYDGENATLKKVEYVKGEDWMKLIPLNPSHPPKLIEGVDLEQCEVLGIPRLLIREIDQ